MGLKLRKFAIIALSLQSALLWCYILFDDRTWSEHRGNSSDCKDVSRQVDTDTTAGNKSVGTRKHNSYSYLVEGGPCSGLAFPAHISLEESWDAVDNDRKAFVFSAYTVEPSHGITIIGAKTREKLTVYCQYWRTSSANKTMWHSESKATMQALPEDHGKRYSATLFGCPGTFFVPTYVSLVTQQCGVPLNLLPVKHVTIPTHYDRRFTVCLQPLHFRYGRAYELVEWIELNILLGAEKFLIYNYSSAINVDRVLDYYSERGLVEVVQWHLPMKINTFPKTQDPVEIHSIGMLAMLQDCFYRSKQYSEFLVNIDVDEFIIPHSKNETTWSGMLNRLRNNFDSYIFRNVFFRKEWNNSNVVFPNNEIAKKLRLVTLQKFERETKIFPPMSRSKYFVRTKSDSRLMIHTVINKNAYVVPPEIGHLHHYRNWQQYQDNSKRIVDDTVSRNYAEKLLESVQRVWKRPELTTVKLDIPIL